MNDPDPAVRRRMKDERDILFAVFSKYQFVYTLLGYAPITQRQLWFFASLLWSSHLFASSMAFFCMYKVWPNISLAFAALHTVTISAFAQWGLAIIFFGHGDLLKIIERIKHGIYLYGEDGDVEEERKTLQKRITKELNLRFDLVVVIFFSGFIFNSLLFPMSQYYFYDKNADIYPIFINPYLIHVFYNPFNSRSTVSITVTYIINFFFILFVYCVAFRLFGIYAACAMNMRVHFDVLSESISNIRERAYKKYLQDHGHNNKYISKEAVLRSDDIHKYLIDCFRANILHHQSLLRFKNETKLIVGNIVLQLFVLAAIVYATIIYQLYQPLPFNILVNYGVTTLAEQAYTFILCSMGEEVITTSGHIFFSLYSIKWFHFNELFKRSLHIAMTNSMDPVEYRALIMNVPASIITFSNSLSIMYKITNFARQSDILN